MWPFLIRRYVDNHGRFTKPYVTSWWHHQIVCITAAATKREENLNDVITNMFFSTATDTRIWTNSFITFFSLTEKQKHFCWILESHLRGHDSTGSERIAEIFCWVLHTNQLNADAGKSNMSAPGVESTCLQHPHVEGWDYWIDRWKLKTTLLTLDQKVWFQLSSICSTVTNNNGNRLWFILHVK